MYEYQTSIGPALIPAGPSTTSVFSTQKLVAGDLDRLVTV